METQEKLRAAWNALSPDRRHRIIDSVRDGLRLIKAEPALGEAAVTVINKEIGVLGVKLDLVSCHEFGRMLGIFEQDLSAPKDGF